MIRPLEEVRPGWPAPPYRTSRPVPDKVLAEGEGFRLVVNYRTDEAWIDKGAGTPVERFLGTAHYPGTVGADLGPHGAKGAQWAASWGAAVARSMIDRRREDAYAISYHMELSKILG